MKMAIKLFFASVLVAGCAFAVQYYENNIKEILAYNKDPLSARISTPTIDQEIAAPTPTPTPTKTLAAQGATITPTPARPSTSEPFILMKTSTSIPTTTPTPAPTPTTRLALTLPNPTPTPMSPDMKAYCDYLLEEREAARQAVYDEIEANEKAKKKAEANIDNSAAGSFVSEAQRSALQDRTRLPYISEDDRLREKLSNVNVDYPVCWL